MFCVCSCRHAKRLRSSGFLPLGQHLRQIYFRCANSSVPYSAKHRVARLVQRAYCDTLHVLHRCGMKASTGIANSVTRTTCSNKAQGSLNRALTTLYNFTTFFLRGLRVVLCRFASLPQEQRSTRLQNIVSLRDIKTRALQLDPVAWNHIRQ